MTAREDLLRELRNPTEWVAGPAGADDRESLRLIGKYRAEVLAEQATGQAVHIFDAVYNALVAYSAKSHAFPGFQYAHLRDDLAQHLTASLLEAGIGGDTIVCDAEGCALPCTPGCPNKTEGGVR